MKTSHRLWDFLLSDREFVSPDDTASPVFSSLFVTCLSAFMNLTCFATLKLCVSEKLTLHGLGFFLNPNEYAELKLVSICGKALHNMCSKRGNISACHGKWVKLWGINVFPETIFDQHAILKGGEGEWA